MRVWRSPWPPSTCWSSGMAYGPTHRVSCPSRSRNLVCKIPMSLRSLPKTNTIGYYAKQNHMWNSSGPARNPHAHGARGGAAVGYVRPHAVDGEHDAGMPDTPSGDDDLD